MMPEEWVIWGYRLLLGREPENSAVIRHHCEDDFSPQRLVRQLVGSAEFQLMHVLPAERGPETPEEAELRQMKTKFTVQNLGSYSGSFTDFLGVRTRCNYLPDVYAQYSGTVEHPDGSGVVPLHEPAEVISLLRSVEEGTGLFTVVNSAPVGGRGWSPVRQQPVSAADPPDSSALRAIAATSRSCGRTCRITVSIRLPAMSCCGPS